MANRTGAGFKTNVNAQFPTTGTGQIGASRVRTHLGEDIADSFLNRNDDLLDEDDMASNSATKVPSQQSVKAYVDAQQTGNTIDLFSKVFDDFNSLLNYLGSGTFDDGGGSGIAAAISTFGVDNTEKCSGVLALSTGTSTAGGSRLSETTYEHTFGFGFSYAISWRIALSALSDGTNTYTIRIGFLDNATGAPTDGAYFRYTHGTNSGKWQAVTVSNSVETAEDTGVAAEASVFHIFKIVANSDATQVDFYIDGNKTNDITTNVINAAARITGKVAHIAKTAGATARLLYIDYFEFISTRSTAR